MAPALASTLFPYTTLFRSCSPSEGSGWIWPPGRDADMKGLTGKQKLGWTVITIVVLLWALGPLLSILMTSFKASGDLNTGNFLPTNVVLDNYREIFAGSRSEE